MGTVTEDHNLNFGPNTVGKWTPSKGAGDVIGDPKFISTDVTNPQAFHIGAGSAAIDIGAMLPVYQDAGGAPRTAGAGWDVGAFEFQP